MNGPSFLPPISADIPARPGIFKHLVRHSAVYSTVGILSRMIAFLMLPVYTRWLTTSDYGTMELLEITSAFIGAIVASRFGDAVTNSYFAAQSEGERRKTISTGVIGMSVVGALLIGLSYFFSPALSRLIFGGVEQASYFRLTFASIGVFLPAEPVFAYLRAVNRSVLYSGLQIFRMVLMVAFNLILLIGLRLGIRGILYSNLAGAVIVQAILTAFAVSRCGWSFGGAIFKRQMRFSLPLVIGPAGMMFVHFGDRIFLKSVVTLGEIGIYALAYKIGMLVSYLMNPVLLYWRSQMYEVVRPGDARMYPRIATYMVLLVVTLGLLCSLFARPMVALMTGGAFHPAAVFVPLVSLGYVMLNVSEFLRSVLLLANRPGREARVMAVGAGFCIAAYSLLIPMYKLWGAAATTTATFAVLLVYGIREAQKALPTRFEIGRLARICVAAAVSFTMDAALPRGGFWLELGEATACAAVYFGALLVSGFVAPDEWRQARSLAASFRRPPKSVAGAA